MPCGWEGNQRLASHWPCVTDLRGLSTYGLTAIDREMSTPPTLSCGVWPIYLFTVVTCTCSYSGAAMTLCVFRRLRVDDDDDDNNNNNDNQTIQIHDFYRSAHC